MKRIARWLALAATLLVLAAIVTTIVGLREAVAPPIERQFALHPLRWPHRTAPIRIALLSDIHLGNRAMTADRLATIIDQVNAARPDLVLIAGDFVNGYNASGPAEQIARLELPLARLRPRLGTFAVFGNHDHWTDPDAIRAVLTRAGVNLLSNQAIRRGPITILGVDDAFTGHDDLAKTRASAIGLGGYPIVLSHTPDLARNLPSDLPLLLAGHTHCGQFVLPFLGPVVERWPFQPIYTPRYRCGLVRDPNHIVIVTAGLGSGEQPIRVGAPSDWWLITLGAQDAQSARDAHEPGTVGPMRKK